VGDGRHAEGTRLVGDVSPDPGRVPMSDRPGAALGHLVLSPASDGASGIELRATACAGTTAASAEGER